MDAIERCLDILDEEGMKELAPRLAEVIKQAVGTPTKVSQSLVRQKHFHMPIECSPSLSFRLVAVEFLYLSPLDIAWYSGGSLR